jgi:hypothetical protein
MREGTQQQKSVREVRKAAAFNWCLGVKRCDKVGVGQLGV